MAIQIADGRSIHTFLIEYGKVKSAESCSMDLYMDMCDTFSG